MKLVFLHHANVCKGGIERMLAMKANLLVEHWEVDPETAKKDTNALVKSWKDANLLDD